MSSSSSSSSSSSLGSRIGVCRLIVNPVVWCPLHDRVAPVFVQVVSPPLWWSHLSYFRVKSIVSKWWHEGPSVVFGAVDMAILGTISLLQCGRSNWKMMSGVVFDKRVLPHDEWDPQDDSSASYVDTRRTHEEGRRMFVEHRKNMIKCMSWHWAKWSRNYVGCRSRHNRTSWLYNC